MNASNSLFLEDPFASYNLKMSSGTSILPLLRLGSHVLLNLPHKVARTSETERGRFLPRVACRPYCTKEMNKIPKSRCLSKKRSNTSCFLKNMEPATLDMPLIRDPITSSEEGMLLRTDPLPEVLDDGDAVVEVPLLTSCRGRRSDVDAINPKHEN